jgi:hypothetical protein
MKIYQVVQNISIHVFIPKASNSLLRFFPTVTTLSGCHGNITTYMSFFPYSKLHALVAIVTLAKDCMWCNYSDPTIKQTQNIAANGWKTKHQLTNLNLNHFQVVEAMGLKLLHRGPLDGITSLPNIMKIYQAVQKLLAGDRQTDTQTDRQIDWWFDKPTFIFGK